MAKECEKCETIKDDKCFKQREDGWGLYAWCELCRRQDGRGNTTRKQKRFIKKTQLFFVGS